MRVVAILSAHARSYRPDSERGIRPCSAGSRRGLRHGLLGEVNANDLSQSRVRYAIGATIQALPPLALLLDIIGSSGIAADHFEQPFATAAGVIPVSGTVARTDLVDLAVGVRITVTQHVLVHLDAIVPLTEDGIRPNVVPAGGIEATF